MSAPLKVLVTNAGSRHGSATDRLVSGIETIVHISDPGPQPAAEDWRKP